MRFVLIVYGLFIATAVNAASYERTDGSIVNPILDTSGSILSYSGPNLTPGVVLSGENLASADLLDADLQGSDMSNINLSSAKMWRSDLRGTNLTSSDLSGVFLFRSDMRGTDMTSAVLPNGDLQEVDLLGATLDSANFQSVKLWSSDMRDTSIRNSDFSGASLGGVDFLGSDLTDTNLAAAKVYQTIFHYVNISGTDLTSLEFYDHADWTNAYYFTDNEPTWQANMDPTFRAAAGIVPLSPGSSPLYPVPEPRAIVLSAIAAIALLTRRPTSRMRRS